MPKRPAILAGILVGGKSTRMGADKAMLPWNASTFLETVVHTARRVTADCVLLGEPAQLPDSLGDMTRLTDTHPNKGPIAGLAALLAHGVDRWCLLLGCDIPNVTVRTLTGLLDRITPELSVIAYMADNHLEPCCALYHPRILPDVEDAIAQDRLALNQLIRTLNPALIPADAATLRTLKNINAPCDYE